MTGIEGGWLVVDYHGHDLARIEIAVGTQDHWQPAFLDWIGGQRNRRVAKIRPPVGGGTVWLRVNGHATEVGTIPARNAPQAASAPSRLGGRRPTT